MQLNVITGGRHWAKWIFDKDIVLICSVNYGKDFINCAIMTDKYVLTNLKF